MKGIFYGLYELNEKGEERRIYTFNNPEDVYELWTWLAQRDRMHPTLLVKEIDADEAAS